MNKIWLDITPIYKYIDKPLDGIARTICMLAKYLPKEDIVIRYCRYNSASFIEVPYKYILMVQEKSYRSTNIKFNNIIFKRENIIYILKKFIISCILLLPEFLSSYIIKILKNIRQYLYKFKKYYFIKNLKFTNTDIFSSGDILFIAGLLWSTIPYKVLEELQYTKSVYTITVIHDLIPIIMPEIFDEPIKYDDLYRVLRGSSLLMTVSEFTDHQLRNIAEKNCIPIKTAPIRWGIEILQAPKEKPERFTDLETGQFILFVSTVNRRKNHEMLYDIWLNLLEENHENLLPLVFVGSLSEASEPFIRLLLRTERIYPKYIKYYQNIDDIDLSWLYSNCRFTVYPSTYEGWGLPVTESLAYGKVCLASSITSIPEAAQSYCPLLHPRNFLAWKQNILDLMHNDELISKLEKNLKNFHSRTWEECTHDVIGNLRILEKSILNKT
jgi:glycosyltransferase involved in cell wall biosynthesis